MNSGNNERRTITLSAVSSILGTLLVAVTLWNAALRPMLITAVAAEATSAASAGIDDRIISVVEAQVMPLEAKVNAGNAGLKAIILGNITALENDISRLEFIRDQPPEGDWTTDNLRELLSKQRSLKVQREALESIQAAERPPSN